MDIEYSVFRFLHIALAVLNSHCALASVLFRFRAVQYLTDLHKEFSGLVTESKLYRVPL